MSYDTSVMTDRPSNVEDKSSPKLTDRPSNVEDKYAPIFGKD